MLSRKDNGFFKLGQKLPSGLSQLGKKLSLKQAEKGSAFLLTHKFQDNSHSVPKGILEKGKRY